MRATPHLAAQPLPSPSSARVPWWSSSTTASPFLFPSDPELAEMRTVGMVAPLELARASSLFEAALASSLDAVLDTVMVTWDQLLCWESRVAGAGSQVGVKTAPPHSARAPAESEYPRQESEYHRQDLQHADHTNICRTVSTLSHARFSGSLGEAFWPDANMIL